MNRMETGDDCAPKKNKEVALEKQEWQERMVEVQERLLRITQ